MRKAWRARSDHEGACCRYGKHVVKNVELCAKSEQAALKIAQVTWTQAVFGVLVVVVDIKALDM